MAKTGKLLRSLIRAGTRTAKLFAAATAPPKPPKPRKPRAAKPGATSSASAAPLAVRATRPVRTVASAPSPAVAPGKWLSGYVPNAVGQRMNYWLYLPDNRSEKGMPLVVMLHGCQQTATQFAQGTRMNLHAEKMGCAVLYPQQSASSHPHRCWKWYERATQEGGGDVPTIISIIHKVLTQYDIDRSRIYVAGISAGAGMAHILALNHPGLFAAIGLHSGPVFGAGHSSLGALSVMKHGALGMNADIAAHAILQRHQQFPGMPAILFQGESDNVVKSINQIELTRQSLLLNRLSAPAKLTEKRHYRLLDYYEGRKLMLRVAQVEKLEHAWSGGDASLKFNDRSGPNASKMMLGFFARHRRV
ncbi:PHB depolymerase family esterase [Duganella sp. sic0402]|uniref:extracellular catalytic domain type 1 short-chain-length polyhydroxyalkanoate depolymerase n=1 Tax=Duganella sp. sic0402 TaxID=2854786 RepID=UPI001C476B5B|nr:PHB depolymerase family esterase [Duganella sp. sic0402]MBV7535852.1 PHB depolymerase family esterase [Duganella sp. sic0402]